MELSITKSRIELLKTYVRFLLSRNFDDFKVITTDLFHFFVYMNVNKPSKFGVLTLLVMGLIKFAHFYFSIIFVIG